MRTLVSYPTEVGVFEIGQTPNRKYHVVFDEESYGEYSSIQDAVDALVDNNLAIPFYQPSSKEPFDTSTLGISRDYTQWDSVY